MRLVHHRVHLHLLGPRLRLIPLDRSELGTSIAIDSNDAVPHFLL
jgi:hypothetical protein